MRKFFFWVLVAYVFLSTTYLVVALPMTVTNWSTDKTLVIGLYGIMGYFTTFLLIFSWREGYIKR